uniref:Uncharacterized protein n=1 Tax=Ditylenchus dipsaci TaxID=166011 RepID=A0A915DN47_9BILA
MSCRMCFEMVASFVLSSRLIHISAYLRDIQDSNHDLFDVGAFNELDDWAKISALFLLIPVLKCLLQSNFLMNTLPPTMRLPAAFGALLKMMVTKMKICTTFSCCLMILMLKRCTTRDKTRSDAPRTHMLHP